ncbi:MAG: hypothetical protein JSW14_00130 [Candidatus Bathyarchaeum sp.]|nr:MAG: hypothetical protein JSW14_00130 [Candidatus Bathyarchaeum sp.]
MKAFTALILAIIIVLIITSPTLAYDESSVGVKKGDWMEYNISITGTGAPPPTHDVNWMRMEILPVQGAAFPVNLTARYSNGTLGSAIWEFNFTEGNVGGWLIIPSNLSPRDTFYDSSPHTGKPVNVTVQSQEQKTVLGASRTVTYGNDSFRHKEWDKATGMFVGSSERIKNVTNKDGWYIEDLTVTIEAIATNMWSPDPFLGVNLMVVFYGLAAVIIVLVVLILVSRIIGARTKETEKLTLSPSLQGKLAALTIIIVVLVEVGIILFFPFYEIGISFAEFNLIMQTLWTGLVLVSMWYRMRGNYFVHEITMLIVMVAWLVGFTAVMFMGPLSSFEMYFGTTLRWIMNILHAVFSIPALIFGLWLVVLWRPGSTSFATKSRRIAQLAWIFWIPSYVVGVLDGILLYTTIFG